MDFVSDSCTVPEEARGIIKHCYDFYNFNEEDKTPVNLPGWRPFNGSVEWANFADLCLVPWQYVPSKKLHNSPSWGFFDIYDGGGYVADLGYSSSTARAVISNLRKYGWIDQQTRAVLLEFTIYNPNTGYLITAVYHFEILPTGYGNPFPKIDTLLLTSTQTGFYQFYLICQLLFIILVVVLVLKEVYNLYRNKWSYFRDMWNWVEILLIFSSVLVVIFYVVKSKKVLKSAAKVKENPFAPVSFAEAITWSHAENAVSAIAVFLTTLKLLYIIRFNPHVTIMMSSFRVSRGLLLSYSVVFAIIFLAYALLGKLTFGNDMQRYSSVRSTLFSEVLMCLGAEMDLNKLMRANRVLGPLFGFSFISLMSFIFVNFFVAILNDSYADVKTNTDKQSKEFEMADFILERLSELLGINGERSQKEGHNDASETDAVCDNCDDVFEVLEQQTSKNCATKSSKRTSQIPKAVVSSEFSLDSSFQEQLFKRMDALTSNLAREDARQDVKMLSIISQLCHRKYVGVSSHETSSTLQDIEQSCSVTCASSSQDNIDKERSTESEDSTEDEILEFIRRRALMQKLPNHLKITGLHEQLRSTLAVEKTRAWRKKTS